MEKFIILSYNDILKIDNSKERKRCLRKYKSAFIFFIKPLYETLNEDQKYEFTEFLNKENDSIYSALIKFKSLSNLGLEEARAIVEKSLKKKDNR